LQPPYLQPHYLQPHYLQPHYLQLVKTAFADQPPGAICSQHVGVSKTHKHTAHTHVGTHTHIHTRTHAHTPCPGDPFVPDLGNVRC